MLMALDLVAPQSHNATVAPEPPATRGLWGSVEGPNVELCFLFVFGGCLFASVFCVSPTLGAVHNFWCRPVSMSQKRLTIVIGFCCWFSSFRVAKKPA